MHGIFIKENLTVPNIMSLLRIVLIVPLSVFILQQNFAAAVLVLLLSALTDMFDGKIARKYNLITNLGKFLDSLADKMLIIGVLLAFVELHRVSAWWVMVICLREFMVTGIRMLASQKGVVMAAKMIGKVKTTFQMIAIIWLMFEPTINKVITYLFNYSSCH